ncbi:hypothetical protein [Actinospica sp.]|uniref:hypothetical protein n=1 Tax=Actinospica sp. TaxID=1872142 RepID=UPI002C3608C5|nr:hypothetical protein [Actinospica sp.]HWG26008.1 hypothetical protein [Actinospica sp.]
MLIRNRLAALGVTTTLALGVSAAVGHAVTDPLPIGPNTAFAGVVNGVEANAVIQVVCPGPVTAGELGHPVSGQYLEVVTGPVSSTDSGFTGSAAHSIDAFIVTPTGAVSGPVVVFNSFYVKEPIPTTIELPCSGTGEATFVPEPTSPTARTAVVSVTFQNIAV